MYYVDEAIVEALKRANTQRAWVPTGDQSTAVELLKKGVSGKISLAAVQGPPGTGKTSVVSRFAEEQLPDIITSNERILIMYISPTNYLVHKAYIDIVAALIKRGIDVQTILRSTRIYGSRIWPFREARTEWKFNDEIVSKQLLKDSMGAIDPDEVRMIFTTEYQRIAGRLADVERSYEHIHIIADEASKSPYFRIFLPLADKLARNPEMYPKSLLVLGDPEQAITVPEEFKEYRVPLLMKYVRNVLKNHGLYNKRWKMLTLSFRLPSPCLLYTSPSPRDLSTSRMPSSA